MARKRTLQLAVLNITLGPPHNPDRYVQLFRDKALLDRATNLRGDWVGLIGDLRLENKTNGTEVLRGEIFKYIDLQITRDWFSVRKRKRAEEEDLEALSIPDDLKPHFQYLPFIFFPHGLKLVLITKDGDQTTSPQQAHDIFVNSFSSTEIREKFGKVDVVIEPSRETLRTILTEPRLRTLEIEVTPPNSDVLFEFEEELFREMHEQHAGRYQIKLQEADDSGLAPNEKTRNLAQVAQSNGVVTGFVGSHGKTKVLSTKDHPLVEKVAYDPDMEIRSEVLLREAIELV
jgi:hypothetical protein